MEERRKVVMSLTPACQAEHSILQVVVERSMLNDGGLDGQEGKMGGGRGKREENERKREIRKGKGQRKRKGREGGRRRIQLPCRLPIFRKTSLPGPS